MIPIPCFQFITPDVHDENTLTETVHQVLEAGILWIQLRLKNIDTHTYTELAKKVFVLTQKYNAILIINDDIEVAKQTQAQGIHAGMKDTPTSVIRTLLPDTIIGGTANTFQNILYHIPSVDYIGLGPYRYTTTKQNLAPVLGKDGYLDIKRQCQQANINIPIIAIGGIQLEDIKILKQCGVEGIAVSQAISKGNVYQNAKLWIETFYTYFATPNTTI